ncbi:MAG: type II toxin-antitoxin system RelE/ParE family toxin [Flavobacteriales bacterium]|nr:type II toxin-antitoxin system RelE/ParE family toxin [Flavobacteriales bacterium]
MSQELEVQESAKQEIAHAAVWYNTQRPGLGDRFLAEVEDGIQRIQRNPEAFPRGRFEARRILMNVFPFTIIYKVHPNAIIIHAVLHTKQRPSKLL